jgi:hypothetical protein
MEHSQTRPRSGDATSVKVPPKGTVEYTYLIVPTGFTEDKWVEQMEVRPGNRAVVHQILPARA